MGRGTGRGIQDDEPFVLDGVTFVPSWVRRSEPGSFTLQKSARMVEAYREVLAQHPDANLVELGIFQGGSVAMLALLARPARFVALEYSDQPIEALQRFIDDRGLGDVVSPHYGVDQADKATVAAIVDEAFGSEPIDVVIDDASHRYAETVATFEVLFPRLAPGGRYVIEDWACDDTAGAAMARALADAGSEAAALFAAKADEVASAAARAQPLSRLGAELVLARAASGDHVAEVRVDETWIEVVRGPAPLDPVGFGLRDLVPDHFGVLTAVPDDLLALRQPPAAAGSATAWWSPEP